MGNKFIIKSWSGKEWGSGLPHFLKKMKTYRFKEFSHLICENISEPDEAIIALSEVILKNMDNCKKIILKVYELQEKKDFLENILVLVTNRKVSVDTYNIIKKINNDSKIECYQCLKSEFLNDFIINVN